MSCSVRDKDCPKGDHLTSGASVAWVDIAPPLVMVSGSILSWWWLAADFPIFLGNITYPLLLSYAFVLVGFMFAFRRATDRILLPWGACALATMHALTAKGLAPTEVGEVASNLVALVAFAGVFITLVVAVAIGRIDARRSVLFAGLYFAWAVTDIPSTFAEGGATTVLIIGIAIVEAGVLSWAIHTYRQGKTDYAVIGPIGLLIAHPFLVGWRIEDGLEVEPTWGQYVIDSLVQGIGFVIFINAILIVFILLLRKLAGITAEKEPKIKLE